MFIEDIHGSSPHFFGINSNTRTVSYTHLDVYKRQFYSIIGQSGAGKTTLLSLLAGLDYPKKGQVLFNGENIKKKSSSYHRRHHVALVDVYKRQGQDLAGVLEAGLEMIKKPGHAEAGEKTMVDVWHPVVEAVKQGQLTNDLIDQAVLSTKEVVATKGRASYVGERSIGHIDPGSYSSGLLFKALLESEG